MAKSKKSPRPKRIRTAPKKCFFCEGGKEPSFKDIQNLQKFLTERGKIIPRSRSGLCSRHQRRITRQIKYARHLALLPFVIR
ncbi:MAG: 30S ribosomal protein S18 [Patescibacteria group bacterium]